MKKTITLIFLLFSVVGATFAQDYSVDVVYLKNGSIIRGVIIEQIPNKSLKIKTESGNVFVYQLSEIEKITKEANNTSSNITESGYWGNFDIGYAIGVGDFGMDRIKLNIINGYQVNPHFALGFGTGVHYYSDVDAALIPIFGDFRSCFLEDEISPYIGIKLGYSFDATNDFEGTGLLLNPSVGIKFIVSNSTALNISLGYEMQKMPFIYGGYYGYYTLKENSGAITIDFGISF